jgi:hypothetical protein
MSDSSSSSFARSSLLFLALSSFLVSLGSADEDNLEKEERELSNAASPVADSHVHLSSSCWKPESAEERERKDSTLSAGIRFLRGVGSLCLFFFFSLSLLALVR